MVDSCSFDSHPLEGEAWKSDYVLSERSQQEFHCVRDELQEILNQHDLEIARVQASLDRLQDQRKSYALRIAKLNSATASHKKLPPELLAKIFSSCSPKPLHIPPISLDDVPPTICPPLNVCSLWRQVALDTRDIWDSIVVSYPYASNPIDRWQLKADNITAAARGALSRGTRSIHLNMYGHRRAFLTKDIDPVWCLIVPFSSQLTHINISCSPHLLYPFLQSPPLPFNVLECLTLNGEEHPTSTSIMEHIPELGGFGNSPSLHTVVISRFYLDFLRYLSADTFHLPWDQLTQVTLQNTWLDVPAAYSVLSRCTSVVHCDLALFSDNEQTLGQPTTPPEYILHRHLQSLRISTTGGSPNVAAEFFQSLILPSLTSVELADNNVTDIIPSFVSFVTRSGCTVQKCVISKAAVPARILELLFPEISPVEELIIPSTLLIDSMIQRIAQGTLLPNLKHVDCSISPSPWTVEYFMRMVQNGGPGNSGLPGLRVAYARYLQGAIRHYKAARWPEVNQRFKELSAMLREEGRILTLKD